MAYFLHRLPAVWFLLKWLIRININTGYIAGLSQWRFGWEFCWSQFATSNLCNRRDLCHTASWVTSVHQCDGHYQSQKLHFHSPFQWHGKYQSGGSPRRNSQPTRIRPEQTKSQKAPTGPRTKWLNSTSARLMPQNCRTQGMAGKIAIIFEKARAIDSKLCGAIMGGTLLVYLFYCYCCLLICQKVKHDLAC